jgi:hypothetical protein
VVLFYGTILLGDLSKQRTYRNRFLFQRMKKGLFYRNAPTDTLASRGLEEPAHASRGLEEIHKSLSLSD